MAEEKKKVGLVYSGEFARHETGQIFLDGNDAIFEVAGQRLVDPFYTTETLDYPFPLPYGAPHPEQAERTLLIHDSLEVAGLLEQLTRLTPEIASLESLEMVHSSEYIARVRRLAEAGGGCLGEGTWLGPASYEIARLSAGAAITAAKQLAAGELKSAFVLSRPPGHHATRDRAAGFCIFNNAAIVARHWQKHHSGQRVMIIDWDVHHGDGTQSIFYEDDSVLYYSMHQYGPPKVYPGTGGFDEIGAGRGAGYNVNVPMPSNAGDKLYLEVFETLVPELAERFRPDLIVVSAGQDGHFKDQTNIYLWDPTGGMALTAQAYHRLTRIVAQLAQKYCEGKYLVLLEGGYNLRNLSNSVVNIVSAMLDQAEMVTENLPTGLPVVEEGADKLIQKVRNALAKSI
jgi:acetoin utilization deacetylase AcuC-like enzyme